MALTAVTCRQAQPAEKPYKLYDSQGLYLLVNPSGTKYWRYKYRWQGKEKALSLGVYPQITLSEARNQLALARVTVKSGQDPAEARKQARRQQISEIGATFEAVAWEWYENRLAGASDSHRSRSKRLMQNDLLPFLGKRPIDAITAPDLLEVIRKIEVRGALDMANRARQAASLIFRYGIVTGRCQGDPARDLIGALKKRKKRHYAAITDPAGVRRLLLAIDNYQGSPAVRYALKLSALLFQRPSEIRTMRWDHICWPRKQWEIPAELMKAGRPHIVPLSTQAIELLSELHGITGHFEYVFPSQRTPRRPMSDNGVRTALRTLNFSNEEMTPHGFRAMARTLLDEELGVRVALIEQQLAHEVRDVHGRAYNRTHHLPQRAEMMQQWADYLDQLRQSSEIENSRVA